MRGAGEARPEIPLRSFQKKNQGVVMLLCTFQEPERAHVTVTVAWENLAAP